MAVDADQVDAIAASVADIYREAETALVRLIRRHLDAGLDSPAAEQRLGTIRALRRGAQLVVASLEADSGPGIRNALGAAYRHGWSNATADLPEAVFPESGAGTNARLAAKQRSGTGFVEALAGALHSDFGDVTRNVLRNVEDAYRNVQAAAAARILTGAETRRQAAQAAWQRLTDRGIMSFTDRAGRRWRLSSYVEMATRTNAQRAAVTGQVDRLDTIGVNLVLVSDSPQECKLCRPFEGKILRTDDGPLDVQVEHPTRDGVMTTVRAYATLDQARAAGLMHPNCRHSVSVYLPGVSKLPAQPTADPDGDKARQRQRELERRIRRQKERADAALTPEAKRAANARVRRAQADLRQHLADNPKLKRLRYREQPGAGNTPPRNGPQGGPAGDLAPPRQPTLDGGPAARPPSRTRRVDDRDQPPTRDREPAPDQPELEAPPPPRVDPRRLTDDELEARMMEVVETDPDEFGRLAAEMDRRENAARVAEPAPPPVPDAIPSAEDLRRLPDDALQDLLDRHTADQGIDDFLSDMLGDVDAGGDSTGGAARILNEQAWRERQRAAAPRPADLSDEDLDAALRDAMAPDADPHAAERLAAEVDRREAIRREREAAAERAREEKRARDRERREQRDADRADRLADLLEEGWDEEEAVEAVYGISVEAQRRARAIEELRAAGYTGTRFEDLARKAYKDEIYRAYLDAQEATRGVLITSQGTARGIDPLELFSGPEARARRWASDELKAWWDEHGRPTFADFKAGLLGRRGEQGGRDFLA